MCSATAASADLLHMGGVHVLHFRGTCRGRHFNNFPFPRSSTALPRRAFSTLASLDRMCASSPLVWSAPAPLGNVSEAVLDWLVSKKHHNAALFAPADRSDSMACLIAASFSRSLAAKCNHGDPSDPLPFFDATKKAPPAKATPRDALHHSGREPGRTRCLGPRGVLKRRPAWRRRLQLKKRSRAYSQT